MIAVIVEGGTDVPYVRKLCAHAGVAIIEPLVIRGGKTSIDRDLSKWANAAKHSPYVILRDLDQDAACAPDWLSTNLPKGAGRWLVVRLAVRAVEAWFLADAQTAASCLHVDVSKLPDHPDAVEDPKATVVELARKSSNETIRRRVAPGPKDSRRVGSQYEQRLIEWSEGWRVEAAMRRSPSLRRAHAAIRRLGLAYDRFLEGAG